MEQKVRGIRKIWRKYFSRNFFRKIFLVYLVIIFAICLILFAVISHNLISIKYEQALVMSDQCLTTVNAFLNNKLDNANSVYQRLYQQKEVWEPLNRELEEPGESTLYTWQQQEIRVAVVNTLYWIDRDFNGMVLGSFADGSLYQYGNGIETAAEEKQCFEAWMKKNEEGLSPGRMVSARTEKSRGNAFSLFLMFPVKSADYRENIGCLGLYFNGMKIRQSYLEYEKYLKGSLYVISREGELLYDSGEEYRLPDGLSPEDILTGQTCCKRIGKWVCNILYSGSNDYYVVNAFPVLAMLEDVKGPQRTIITVFFLALLVAAALNYASTYFFSKRLDPIMDTISQVREGKLTSFPIRKKYDDELGDIYTELIRMCASLDDYIQKEYVYRLEQKEMELYALQAQIDPHFLYNTLEAIRMKLYIKGETEASKMIWMLSDLFRSLMKKDTVVTNREEIKYLHSYLELFKLRLGSRMCYTFDVEEEVYRYATIKHILQPVVENALVHGIDGTGTQEHPCTVSIEGRKENEDIIFTVGDDGCGISEEKLKEIREKLEKDELFQKSIGIYNVSSRLRIVYGPSYRLLVESEEGKGTTVTVKIKALKKKELEEYVQTVDR